LSEELSRELASSIIERTSGSACPRVEESLCSYVDEELNAEDSQLISAHLDSCPSCRALADGLVMMNGELPLLAEVEPDAGFARSVLEATSRWRPFRPSPRTRFLTWWNRLIQRPRFSFEAAYVGTLVLVFAFGNPVPALRSIAMDIVSSPSFQTGVRKSIPANFQTGWTDAEAPALRLARTFVATASQREQAASSFLKNTTRGCGRSLQSALTAHAESLDSWKQVAVGALRGFWSNLTARITRARS
jgi:hypothetical protein